MMMAAMSRKPVAPEESALGEPSLFRLMAWLSPSFPVGAFSYSSGLEWAVEAGDITDASSLRRWLTVILAEGGVFCLDAPGSRR